MSFGGLKPVPKVHEPQVLGTLWHLGSIPKIKLRSSPQANRETELRGPK
jgi:hypothetical protein